MEAGAPPRDEQPEAAEPNVSSVGDEMGLLGSAESAEPRPAPALDAAGAALGQPAPDAAQLERERAAEEPPPSPAAAAPSADEAESLTHSPGPAEQGMGA